LRDAVTVISQDVFVFSGSWRANLNPFDKHSDDKIWHALELSSLKEYVQSLPGGLESHISDLGGNLSHGQVQLLCLTRALLDAKKLLLVDEATASLDADTDKLVQATLRSQFKDTTVITIAHRQVTIQQSDSLLVMSDGQVAEFGTPSDLLRRPDGMFRSMADASANSVATTTTSPDAINVSI
jgi:ATP-binding cassette subfamily C (CFTR/MRP) protein 1